MNAKLILIILLLLSACSLPQTKTKYVRYNSSNLKIVASKVQILEERYPKGITLKNNVVEVLDEYKDKIKLLGRIEINLKRGFYAGYPFPMNLGGGLYYDRENKSGLHNYCEYNMLSAIPFLPGLNTFNPFAWPCFFVTNHGSEDDDDHAYRRGILEGRARAKAAEKGANMVVGFAISGTSLLNAVTGAKLADYDVWSATGYAIRVNKD